MWYTAGFDAVEREATGDKSSVGSLAVLARKILSIRAETAEAAIREVESYGMTARMTFLLPEALWERLQSLESNTAVSSVGGVCGCGRPVRYLALNAGVQLGSCNKYARCATWDELKEENSQLRADLQRAKQYCQALAEFWGWKKNEDGLGEEYSRLVAFIKSVPG